MTEAEKRLKYTKGRKQKKTRKYTNCAQCGGAIPAHRRSHAKYCSDTCKAKKWENSGKRHEHQSD